MEIQDVIVALVLAVVEGITEFLPISSTGHMILVEQVLPFSYGEGFRESFIVVIQLPAVLSVLLYFHRRLFPGWVSPLLRTFRSNAKATSGTDTSAPLPMHSSISIFRVWVLIVLAFIPAGIAGFLLRGFIEERLFHPLTVAVALAVGGILLIVLERILPPARTLAVEKMGYGEAFAVGVAQCAALVPGVSRSAATIIGGMALGLSRTAAAEFSFFLAIPTMAGASTLSLLKHGMAFTPQQWGLLLLGSVVSFAVAYASIAFLMRIVQRHSFAVFGWYRLILGGCVLLGHFFRG
jgi:undecaprenyl-diphosphatase